MACAVTRRWRPAATSRCSRITGNSMRPLRRLRLDHVPRDGRARRPKIATRERRSGPRGRFLGGRSGSASAPRGAFALPREQARGRRPTALAQRTDTSACRSRCPRCDRSRRRSGSDGHFRPHRACPFTRIEQRDNSDLSRALERDPHRRLNWGSTTARADGGPGRRRPGRSPRPPRRKLQPAIRGVRRPMDQRTRLATAGRHRARRWRVRVR
jgi:hypothetical protein